MLQPIEALLKPNEVTQWQEKIHISCSTKILTLTTANEEVDSIEQLFGILNASKGVSLEAMDTTTSQRGNQHDYH